MQVFAGMVLQKLSCQFLLQLLVVWSVSEHNSIQSIHQTHKHTKPVLWRTSQWVWGLAPEILFLAQHLKSHGWKQDIWPLLLSNPRATAETISPSHPSGWYNPGFSIPVLLIHMAYPSIYASVHVVGLPEMNKHMIVYICIIIFVYKNSSEWKGQQQQEKWRTPLWSADTTWLQVSFWISVGKLLLFNGWESWNL